MRTTEECGGRESRSEGGRAQVWVSELTRHPQPRRLLNVSTATAGKALKYCTRAVIAVTVS